MKSVAFTPAELAGLPADFLAAHPPGPDGKIVLTTDYPDYFPVRGLRPEREGPGGALARLQ